MSRRGGHEKRKSRTITCSPLEWETIRVQAAATHKTMSAYMLDRVPTGGTVDRHLPQTENRLALSREEQHALYATVMELAELVGFGTFQADAGAPGLVATVQVLFEAKAEEMIRLGRDTEMRDVLCRVMAADQAQRVADTIYARFWERRPQ